MPANHPEKIFFFVDGEKYETDQATLTGAQIKARVPNLDPTFTLFLEGHGNEEDRLIGDDDSVSLERDKGPRRFFTAPPATFGS
jgi:hypothetical protein